MRKGLACMYPPLLIVDGESLVSVTSSVAHIVTLLAVYIVHTLTRRRSSHSRLAHCHPAMTASPELVRLLRVLDDRDVGLGPNDVAWAFDSVNTKDSIASWVQEYLSPATLLTREEAALLVLGHLIHSQYADTDISEQRGLSRTSQLQNGPPILVEDFESAISALEASTASIEKQCQLLEAQKNALLEIQARNASNKADGVKAQRSSKFTREKSHAEFEASELADALQSKIERSLKQCEGATDGIQSTVERVLEKDDRLLDGLQKVLPQLADAVAGSENVDEIERL